MRTIAALLLVALLPGCFVEVLTTTAIQGELASEAATTATRQLTLTQDEQSRVQLQQAVNAYASLNGFFPANVTELVPDYLDSVPTTTTGLAFVYDGSSGSVRHPSQGQPTSGYGVTMSTPPSGSAAGQIENISGEHTRRQLEALEDLDL